MRKIRFGLAAAVVMIGVSTSARAELLYTTNGTAIARFDSAATGVVTSVPVTGLQVGETLVGLDVRPATGVLYGLGSASRLYTLNPLTGTATQVGTAGAFTLNGTSFGTDFNPVPDRVRVVSNTGQSLRLNPDSGGLAATDTAITPAGTAIAAVAYDRNFPRLGGDTTPTTLYGIDSAAGTLVTIGSLNGSPNSPNGGVTSPVGSLGLGTNLNDNIGFDISGTGAGFASITTGGTSRLYSINLSTGAATLVGSIGAGTTPFSGLAAATAPEPGAFALLGAAAALAMGRRRRV
jgi:hypothetical protein